MSVIDDNPCCYVVSTPIGNMGDVTSRAIKTLNSVDYIYAEDSRQTHKLLKHFNSKNIIYQLHKYNEASKKKDIANYLDKGKSVAIVSDAGTPLIADPGYMVLAYLRQHNYPIKVIPGCSAVTAALSIAGLPSDNFQFIGFVPNKAKQRQKFLTKLLYCQQTTVFFEAPHRIEKCLADCLEIFGGMRKIFIGRELTKKFEDSALLTLSKAQSWITACSKRQKGEFVLILAASTITSENNWQNLVKLLLSENITTKNIVTIVAKYTGESKKIIYQYVLSITPKDKID